MQRLLLNALGVCLCGLVLTLVIVKVVVVRTPPPFGPVGYPPQAPPPLRYYNLAPQPSTVDARLTDLEERVRSLEGYRGYRMRQDGADRAQRTWQAR